MVDADSEPLPEVITDEAARWVADSFDGLRSMDQRAQLDAWLAADPRHARAFAEMRDVWKHMGGVVETPTLRASMAPVQARRRSHGGGTRGRRRHRPRWMTGALAASLALVFLGVADDWPTRLRADAITGTGERRTLALPDGSSVQLDTQSAVAINFDGDRRMVRLLKGEAAFTVARDPRRPFTVEAGGGSTTALGTQFLVATEGGDTSVTVTEHRVRVAYPTAEGRAALLDEGQRISYGPSLGLGRTAAVNTATAAAWTQGMLVFKDAPLEEVVAAIGRYHRGYVRVTGDAQALRVSGVFRIDDPVAALGQLQRSLGLRSARLTDRLIFIFT